MSSRRKMVSLTENTYNKLKKLGQAGDSFEKVIAAIVCKSEIKSK
jgi:predicted CopG family antitoxin